MKSTIIKLIKVTFVLVTTVLSVIDFAISGVVFEQIGILPASHAHDLGLTYLFYGAIAGFVIGLTMSLYIVQKKEKLLKSFFYGLLIISGILFLIVFLMVKMSFIKW